MTCRTWVAGFFEEGASGRPSSKRLVMISAGMSLSLAVVILSVSTLFGYDTAAALGAVSVPLAGLGGYGYVHGKRAERQPAVNAGDSNGHHQEA